MISQSDIEQRILARLPSKLSWWAGRRAWPASNPRVAVLVVAPTKLEPGRIVIELLADAPPFGAKRGAILGAFAARLLPAGREDKVFKRSRELGVDTPGRYDCGAERAAAVRAGVLRVAHVTDARLETGLQNRGIGRLGYEALLSWAADHNAALVPARCIGLPTSPAAERTWRALSRDFPSAGPVVWLKRAAGGGRAARRGRGARRTPTTTKLTTLFRAADDPIARPGAHFAKERAAAEAYLDNPGYGGATVYVYEVDGRSRLEVANYRELARAVFPLLTPDERAELPWHEGLYEDDPWQPPTAHDLAEDWQSRGVHSWVHDVLENTDIVDVLVRKYQWITFPDSYPPGAETWRYLAGQPITPSRRRSEGRAARRTSASSTHIPARLWGGGRLFSSKYGYTFDAEVMTADQAISALRESICEGNEENPDCFEDLPDPWLDGVEDESRDLVLYIDKLAFTGTRRRGGWGRKFARAIEAWGRREGAVGALLHAGSLWGGIGPSDGFWAKQGYEITDLDDGLMGWKFFGDARSRGRANLAPTARTAITRGGPSAPVKALVQKKLVRGRVLDYGAGRGEDVKWLRAQGHKVTAYDPHHGPQKEPSDRFDTILVTYVLNVLPRREQQGVVAAARRLLAPRGRVYVTVRTDTCPTPPPGVQTCVTSVAGGAVVSRGGGFKTWELR